MQIIQDRQPTLRQTALGTIGEALASGIQGYSNAYQKGVETKRQQALQERQRESEDIAMELKLDELGLAGGVNQLREAFKAGDTSGFLSNRTQAYKDKIAREGKKYDLEMDVLKATAAEKRGAPQKAALKTQSEAIDNLRKEITGLPATKSLVEIDSALSKIRSAEKSPAGDITRVFSFMKLNDPNSTVREGEYATAQNAAGVPERVRAAYNKALTGEVLTDEQRKDFEKSAAKLGRSQYQTYKSVISPQLNRIKELNLDQNQIMPQFSQQSIYDAVEEQTNPTENNVLNQAMANDIKKQISGMSREQKIQRAKEIQSQRQKMLNNPRGF